MEAVAFTSSTACAVDDGQTISIYARPADAVAAELNALQSPREVTVDAAAYEDAADCLADAARDYATSHDLAGWSLDARWGDNQRETIILTVPHGEYADWCAANQPEMSTGLGDRGEDVRAAIASLDLPTLSYDQSQHRWSR